MAAINQFREMLQRGEYDSSLRQTQLIAELEKLRKTVSVHDEDCLDAAALLSELYDQTSRYVTAASMLSFDPRGREALRKLKEAADEQQDRRRSDDLSYIRPSGRMFRTRAMFCLAHAISLHRQTGDRGISLGRAIELGEAVQGCLRDLELAGFHFQGAQSYVAYWLGRFYIIQNRLDLAEQAFNKSIYFQQANLEFHLHQHIGTASAHNGDSIRSCRICQAQISLTNYLLASNMAFGAATTRLKAGNISQALILLRPAIILLEGSTNDRYRKGYARLLTGTAHRIMGGSNTKKMRLALPILQQAKELFGTERDGNAAHRYYSARASYQLCLANVYIAMDKEAGISERTDSLTEAISHYCDVAHPGTMRDEDEKKRDMYADLTLRVRLRLLASSIVCELVDLIESTSDVDLLKFIRTQLSPIPAVERFSIFLHTVRTPSGNTAGLQQIASRLLAEARENIKLARKDGVRLHGEHSRATNVLLADAAIASVAYERAQRAMVRTAQTVDGNSKQDEVKSAVNRLQQAKTELTRVKEDLESFIAVGQRADNKSLSAAHVAIAKVLFLEGNRVASRRHLESGWRPLREKVENQVIHDRAQELLAKMPKAEDELVIPLVTDGTSSTGGQIIKEFYRRLVKGPNEEGLSEEALARRLGVDVKTIKSYCKRGGYTWVRDYELKSL
jgi:tetratricopeptide (TPR) repeat protein